MFNRLEKMSTLVVKPALLPSWGIKYNPFDVRSSFFDKIMRLVWLTCGFCIFVVRAIIYAPFSFVFEPFVMLGMTPWHLLPVLCTGGLAFTLWFSETQYHFMTHALSCLLVLALHYLIIGLAPLGVVTDVLVELRNRPDKQPIKKRLVHPVMLALGILHSLAIAAGAFYLLDITRRTIAARAPVGEGVGLQLLVLALVGAKLLWFGVLAYRMYRLEEAFIKKTAKGNIIIRADRNASQPGSDGDFNNLWATEGDVAKIDNFDELWASAYGGAETDDDSKMTEASTDSDEPDTGDHQDIFAKIWEDMQRVDQGLDNDNSDDDASENSGDSESANVIDRILADMENLNKRGTKLDDGNAGTRPGNRPKNNVPTDNESNVSL